jgi:hypothetical protein
MYPTNTTFLVSPKSPFRLVSAKAPGNFFSMTFSPLFGANSSNSSASSVPGVKTGAPSGTECFTWMIFPDAERYLSRSDLIALRDVATLETLSFPCAYSFCASIITKTESEVDAVEGGIPRISVLNDGVELDIFTEFSDDLRFSSWRRGNVDASENLGHL